MCITKTELEKAVEEIRKLKALQEELNDEIQAIEFQIIGYMREHKLNQAITNSAKVTYRKQTRTTLDQEALTKVLGDDLEQFKKTTTYDVLRIK